MQMQRMILWAIFMMSLFWLWDAWQQHNGNPSFLSPAQQSSPADAPLSGAPATATPNASGGGVPEVGTLGTGNGTPSAGVPAAATATATATATAPTVADAAQGEVFKLRNDVLDLNISATGAVISRAELLQHKLLQSPDNVVLLDTQPTAFYVAQTGLINAPAGSEFPTHHTPFTRQPESTESNLVVAAEKGGLKVVREYSLSPGDYVITVRETLTNVGDAPLNPVVYRQLTRDNHSPPGDTFFYATYAGPVIYTDEQKFQKVHFEDIVEGDAKHATTAPDGWVGMIQHYFASAWLPPEGVPREFYTQRSGTNLVSAGFKRELGALAPGASTEASLRLYVGPEDQRVLEKLAPGLDLTVDYGWLTVIAKPIHWLLAWLHTYVVSNWGWAIVLLTLIIKTIFFPLQAASYRSMARMKAVAPRLTALRERYGDDRAKMNQAMMELYKTEKINPLGGCLPILVQIPVFISLYWVLQASVEMRGAPWIGWITDLASPDPYYILPVLMAVSMFVQVRLNPKPPDPMQAKVMMFMPIAFSVMFFFFPAGLVLYWLVNNLYSIAQQWVIQRKILAPKV